MPRKIFYLKVLDGLLGVDEDARVLAERVQVFATQHDVKLVMLSQARSLDGDGDGIVCVAESPDKQRFEAFIRELYRLPQVSVHLAYSVGRDYLAADGPRVPSEVTPPDSF